MKLTLKIALLLSLVMAAVLSSAWAGILMRESALLEGDVRRDARLIATTLASMASHINLAEAPPAALEALLREITEDADEVQVAWRAADGRDAPSLPPEAAGALARGAVYVTEVEGATGSRVVAWAPVTTREGGPGGLVEVSETLAHRDAFVQRNLRMGAAVVVAITVASGLVSLVLGRRLVGRRVDLLVEKARQVARGDLDHEVPVVGDDELSALALALNRMSADLDRLQRTAAEEARARLAAERALLHADRLRTVGVLAAGVAHELGTPLNVITGRARLIERAAGDDERVGRGAGVIREQASRIARIVRMLLDFSRHDTPRARECRLDALVAECLELLASPARKAEVSLVACPAPAGGVLAVVDPEQLRQVVINLVMNAIQASPPGGRVEVEVGRTADGELRMAVRDDGPGVADADREHVFDPFFTTKPPGEGTGLGLSIVRRIVEDHGGRIAVLDAPGGGAEFVLHIPAGETA